MDTSTIVNIILCVLSFVLAAISVITVIITLRQNNKMIESSTRPYIVVYSTTKNFQAPVFCLCVKNFGQSGALISKFECDCNLEEYSFLPNRIPFAHLQGTFMAPEQSFICSLEYPKSPKQLHPLTFTIEYIFNSKKYSDTFTLDPRATIELANKRYTSTTQNLHVIENTLQDIAERLL